MFFERNDVKQNIQIDNTKKKCWKIMMIMSYGKYLHNGRKSSIKIFTQFNDFVRKIKASKQGRESKKSC